MDQFLDTLVAMNPVWIYIVVAGIAYLENIFPPFPSDLAIVAAGSLVGLGTIGFLPLLIGTTIASTLGFATMHRVGDWFGDRILESGKIPFIPLENVHKVEKWFRKYGYAVIIANRFLAGTRAVVSFFAGMSELPLLKTSALSFLSALAWNSILIASGKALGDNWESIALYLETYSKTVTLVVLIALLVLIAHFLIKQKESDKARRSKGSP